jgi:hypothetical protein
MEPTSSADHARQSRGLARFWPGHAPAPGQRDSDEDDATLIAHPPGLHESHSGSAQAAAAAHLAEQGQNDTQMVALGSRGNAFPRPWDDDQGGFPPVDSERAQQNGETPRHGGAPIPNGTAPMPAPRPVFGSSPAFPGAPASPFAPQTSQPPTAQPPTAQPPTAQPPTAQPPIAQPYRAPEPQQQQTQPPIAQPQQAQPPAAQPPQSPAQRPPAGAKAAEAMATEAEVDDDVTDDDEREIRAIPLGSVTGRRRTPDEAEESDEIKLGEPGGNGKVAGWATVPTSGIPSLAKQATPVPAARRSASLEDADSLPRAGRGGDDKAATAGPLKPGDVMMSQIAFWDEEAITHFRKQWHEVKADFVDDPVAALTRAHDLLTEAVNELTEALLAERDELDPLDGTSTPDTESMRMAMRGYREFLDRILAL